MRDRTQGNVGNKKNWVDNSTQTPASAGTGYLDRPKSADEILLERSLSKELGLDGKGKNDRYDSKVSGRGDSLYPEWEVS